MHSCVCATFNTLLKLQMNGNGFYLSEVAPHNNSPVTFGLTDRKLK